MLQPAGAELAQQRPHQPADVEPDRAQHRVQRVALAALEPAALHAVVLLGVPDQRLDGLAPLEPALLILTQGTCTCRSGISAWCRRSQWSIWTIAAWTRTSAAVSLPIVPTAASAVVRGYATRAKRQLGLSHVPKLRSSTRHLAIEQRLLTPEWGSSEAAQLRTWFVDWLTSASPCPRAP